MTQIGLDRANNSRVLERRTEVEASADGERCESELRLTSGREATGGSDSVACFMEIGTNQRFMRTLSNVLNACDPIPMAGNSPTRSSQIVSLRACKRRIGRNRI